MGVDDFYDLDWINTAEYKGHQKYQEVDCYVYHSNATANSVEQTAYINVKTGLPQGIDTTDATLTYSFRPSTDPLEVPKDVDQRVRGFLELLHPKAA
jgi:hypothetical protein